MRKKHGGGMRKYRRLSTKRDWSSELEPTDPVQGPIPSVNDTEIKKQL